MFKRIILENGLRIILVPQESTQAVTVLILVKTGSKYETKKTKGISHFLEHLYFKGTKKRPSSLLVAKTLDKLGGVYNAFTSEEYTGYYAKVASVHFDNALDWVADIFLNSLLLEKEIEKERRVIMEEINMYLDTPMIYINELWKNLLYGDQPSGWDVIGSKETVSNITKKQILDYVKRQYVASNTIVCVAGNISLSHSIKEVKKHFSKINKTKPRSKPLVFEKQKKPEINSFFKKTDQTHLALGVRAFNLFHPQRFVLNVLANILGGSGMMSSRLFLRVREKLGLAYYVKTGIDCNPDTGFLVTRAGVDNRRAEKAILAILKEYKRISQKKVPLPELKKAKENLKGKLTLYLEPSDAKASFYAEQDLLENKILTPEEIFKEIDKVSQNDILKVAKEIFKPNKLNLALIGPFKEKERFQKLLNL